MFNGLPSLGYFPYTFSRVFLPQDSPICWPPATLAPSNPALSDQWTPSWTPPMISWGRSSKRSAACSLTATFTWEVMRWTSRAGETGTSSVPQLKVRPILAAASAPQEVQPRHSEVHGSAGLWTGLHQTGVLLHPGVGFLLKSGFWVKKKLFNYFCFFILSLVDIVSSTNKGYIVWQEVFDNGVKVGYMTSKRFDQTLDELSLSIRMERYLF